MYNLTLKTAYTEIHCDFVLYDKKDGIKNQDIILVASLFSRSNVELRSFCANTIGSSTNLFGNGEKIKTFSPIDYENYFFPINMGYEKMTHAMMFNKSMKNYILCKSDTKDLQNHFYNYLMNNFDLPLMNDWMPYITSCALYEKVIVEVGEVIQSRNTNASIRLNNEDILVKDISVYSCDKLSLEWLESIVEKGLRHRHIMISQKTQFPLFITNLDSYFSNYGHTIIDNLDKQLRPLTPLKGKVDELALKNKQLFPQQAAVVNGAVSLLNKSNYAFLIGGMGCGKTIMGASIIEAYFVSKYLNANPKMTLKDVYLNSDLINYRIVVMCPGHLVEKWAKECKDEIPYVNVVILNNLDQLITIKSNGKKRKGREIFIIGKDFCKLSYSYIPVPTKMAEKIIPSYHCDNCSSQGTLEDYKMNTECGCGSRGWRKNSLGNDKQYGLLCPECGELLITNQEVVLTPDFFAKKTNHNLTCRYCDCQLWAPNVSNINGKLREKKWYKISHFSNMAKKARTSSWVLNGNEDFLLSTIVKNGIEKGREVLGRRISPAYFMKKQLNDYFDIAIFDEAHCYKGGATAQGNAMHTLIKVSRKQLALTGTIAGGYAEHLFYLLYRLDPHRMNEKGYKFTDTIKFTELYGTVESIYEVSKSSNEHNSSSRGRKIGTTQAKPGISPLIFRDFLMDKALFIDLIDMSKNLPRLIEEIVTVPMETDIKIAYNKVINALKVKRGLNALTSTMLQFSLSYADMPTNKEEIRNPKTGEYVIETEAFDIDDYLLPKEEILVDIVNTEIEQGRNVFIYCEFTGESKKNICDRLYEVLDKYCNLKGKIEILHSSSPKPADREKWIHKKAQEGIKVIITNPACVETGLDFVFDIDNIRYNYPTLVFFQMGYNLFTLWQASRRHYRLNQNEECRTFYLAYSNTIQEEVIRIMGEKQVATSAIQGKFSAEGLAAMSNGVDARVRLVQALINNSDDSIDNRETLQNMFDVLNKSNNESDDEFTNTIGNENFYIVIGSKMPQINDISTIENINTTSILESLYEENTSLQDEDDSKNKILDSINKVKVSEIKIKDIDNSFTLYLNILDAPTIKKTKSIEGQLSIF